MVLPILRFFDQLHEHLDAAETYWPLNVSRLAWIWETHRMLYDEWMDLQQRMQKLMPLFQHGEEAAKRFRKSVGYFELNMFQQAGEQLDAIIRHVPDTLLCYLLRAAVYYELKDYENALRDLRFLESILDPSPMAAVVRHLHACALAKTGRWEEAKERFEQLFRANPSNEEVMFNLALCYYHLGLVQKAVYWMRNVSALCPNDQEARQLLAYFTHIAAT